MGEEFSTQLFMYSKYRTIALPVSFNMSDVQNIQDIGVLQLQFIHKS